MKLYIVLFFVLMSFGKIYSQNSFYIVPSINTKFGVGSTEPFFFYSNSFPTNDFFELKNKGVHHVKSILIGAAVGWRNTNHDFLLDFSWNQDNSSLKNETILLTQNESLANSYFNQNLFYSFSNTVNRFSINFSKFIVPEKLYLKFGMGLLCRFGGVHHNQQDVGSFYFDDENLINISYRTTGVNKVNFNLSAGFGLDLKWSDKYLFTIEAIYSQSLNKNLLLLSNKYEVLNTITGEQTNLTYLSASKGSGFILSISRRFQLYPWIKSKRKELQEQGVYKSREK